MAPYSSYSSIQVIQIDLNIDYLHPRRAVELVQHIRRDLPQTSPHLLQLFRCILQHSFAVKLQTKNSSVD